MNLDAAFKLKSIGASLKNIVVEKTKDVPKPPTKSKVRPPKKEKDLPVKTVTKAFLAAIDAAMYGRLEELKKIIQEDPTALKGKESDGWTAGHWAARRGNFEIMAFIGDRSPTLLSAQANDGSTPAHYAASHGHVGILSLIGDIDPGSLMIKDQNGDTPAHDATKHNSLVSLMELIGRCPSLIYVSNVKGLRPIDLAERDEIKHFLKEAEKKSMVPAVQLQTLSKENRLLSSQNAVLQLYSRNTWESKGVGLNDRYLFKVPKDSSEYFLMQSEFSRTMSKATVVGLQRHENRKLLDSLMDYRDSMKAKMGPKWNEHMMERWLFYDCDPSDPCTFKRNDSGKFGVGIYLNREASYTDDRVVPGPDGSKTIAIVRSLIGSVVKGSPGQAELPVIPGQSGSYIRKYDSFVDYLEEPTLFVIPNEAALYVAYLVQYTV